MEGAMGITRYRWGIPAFGEWNYDHGAGDGDYDWSVLTQRFDSVMTQIPFPVQKPCRKRATASRRRRVPAFGEWNNEHIIADDGEGGWTSAVKPYCFEPDGRALKSLRQDDNGAFAMGMQQHKAWVAESEAHVEMAPFSFTVVEAVDDDLYEVPRDTLCGEPMRRKGRMWLTSLLMRCFGVNCFN